MVLADCAAPPAADDATDATARPALPSNDEVPEATKPTTKMDATAQATKPDAVSRNITSSPCTPGQPGRKRPER